MSSAVAPAQPAPRARRCAARVGEMLMRLTLSVIKADVGSVGGHTKPCARMMATVESEVGAYNLPLYISLLLIPCIAPG